MHEPNTAQHKRQTPWFALIYLAAIIVIVTAATLGLGPKLWAFIYIVPLADKIAHAILIGGLTIALHQLWPKPPIRIGKRNTPRICPWLTLLVSLEECSQIFIATRTFDLGDLAGNWIGIATAGLITSRHKDKQVKKSR